MEMKCQLVTPKIVLSAFSDIDRGFASATQSPALSQPSVPNQDGSSVAVLLKDVPQWLAHVRTLNESDIIVLLTPVTVPLSQDQLVVSDPFEPLGLALARRHGRIRHVPYTQGSELSIVLDYFC